MNIHSFPLVTKEENMVTVYKYVKVINTKEEEELFRVDQMAITNGMKLRSNKPWNIFLRVVLEAVKVGLVRTLGNVL